MLLPSRFYAAAVLCAILLPLAGQAFAKGIDTDATTTDLPFNVQGNLVMDMTGTGLAVGPSAVDLTTTGNVTATSSVNAPSVNATNVTAASAVSAGGNVSAGGAVTAVGNVTGANLVVSGAPAYPINNAGAYTVFDLATLGACTANQALTKNANGSFACAQVSSLAATIPTCAAGYFLTFDGTAFSCANGASAASTVTSSAVLAALPQCSSGQTLLSNGNGGWSCGSPPTSSTASGPSRYLAFGINWVMDSQTGVQYEYDGNSSSWLPEGVAINSSGTTNARYQPMGIGWLVDTQTGVQYEYDGNSSSWLPETLDMTHIQ